MAKRTKTWDVLIIGGGAAGVGMAHVLKTLGIRRFTVLERSRVGESFRRWPQEMRFITPSFTSNAFGLPDLNAITMDTSPAYTLDAEHPCGKGYAIYLQAIVDEYELPVEVGVNVLSIQHGKSQRPTFEVVTNRGTFRTRFVIWAAGEFQYPHRPEIPGAHLGIHTSEVRSWKDVPGDDLLIIGGYESGIDAATALCELGKKVTVIDRQNHWKTTGSDPSQSLSPYTIQRLRAAEKSGRLTLVDKTRIRAIEQVDNRFIVRGRRGKTAMEWSTLAPPLLATGFASSLTLIDEWLVRDENGWLQLTENDESAATPNLFLCGPMVRHDAVLMCFIYKFRQRFAVVAHAIAERLGLDTSPLEAYRSKQMYLDDLSCCLDECAC